jgi:hypothetical protein
MARGIGHGSHLSLLRASSGVAALGVPRQQWDHAMQLLEEKNWPQSTAGSAR